MMRLQDSQKDRTYEEASYQRRNLHLFRALPHHLGPRILRPLQDLHDLYYYRRDQCLYPCCHDPDYVRVVFFPPWIEVLVSTVQIHWRIGD